MKILRRWLGTCVALATIVVLASTTPASATGTTTLAGTYDGDYTGTTDTLNGNPFVVGSTIAGTVTVTAQSGGKAAQVTLATSKFTAHILFRRDGTAHTDAIVPGIADKMGDGTWSISSTGKVLSYKLTSSEPVTISFVSFATGKLSTRGKIKISGLAKKFSIKGKATGTSNLGLIKGHYKFK